MGKKKAGKPKAWRDFELEVAQLYKDLGAVNVSDNVNIDGHQIDVYAEVPTVDGDHIKTIISCKCYNKAVGVPDVRELFQVFGALRQTNKAEAAVLVSAHGFTQDADPAAKAVGIRLRRIEDLRLSTFDFVPYVRGQLREFQEERPFLSNYYLPTRICKDGSTIEQPAYDAVQEFIKSNHCPLLTILGDYGAGKTTFCKHMFIEMAKAFLTDPKQTRMPVFVNLRNYPSHVNLQSLITDLLVNRFGGKCRGFSTVEGLLRDGKMLIFFDAFDEMASRMDYQTTLQNFYALEGLLKGNATVILTCRTHYYKDQDELHSVQRGTELYKRSTERHYEIMHVQGLRPEEIETYVKAVCGSDWASYHETIKETYNLQALAQRPILLDMITTVLPDLVKSQAKITSVKLYAIYTDRWLERDDWRTKLNRKARRMFTLAFAYAMYSKNRVVFSWKDVEEAIMAIIGHVADGERFEYDVRVCTFIRRDPQTEEYQFIHDSFMEFFVASYIYGEIVDGRFHVLEQKVHTQQVLAFLAEHPSTEQVVSNLVSAIKSTSSDNLTSNCLYIIGRWAGTVRNVQFSEVKFRTLRLPSIKLANAVFLDCEFVNVVFHGDSFSSCEFTSVKMSKCEVDACQLFDCVFQEVDMADATVRGCKFTRGRWDAGSIKGSFMECGFDQFGFVNCIVEECSFSNCNFSQLSISVEKLKQVRFVGCRFERVSWRANAGSNIEFENCWFSDEGIDLSNALLNIMAGHAATRVLFKGIHNLQGKLKVKLAKQGVCFH